MENRIKLINRNVLIKHLFVVLVIVGYYLVLHLLSWTCPFKAIFGISCPTCGTTRSLLALVRLDFSAYWYFHPAGILVVMAVLIGFHFKILDKYIKPWITRLLFYVMIVLIMVTYIIRMFNGTIPH